MAMIVRISAAFRCVQMSMGLSNILLNAEYAKNVRANPTEPWPVQTCYHHHSIHTTCGPLSAAMLQVITFTNRET